MALSREVGLAQIVQFGGASEQLSLARRASRSARMTAALWSSNEPQPGRR
jgi:hypothetical protein